MSKLGVVIGRFQTPYLTKAHKNLITVAGESVDKLVIFVGCSPFVYTKRNPLDFHTRAQLIHRGILECPSLKKLFGLYNILPIMDCESDSKWSKRVDDLIASLQHKGEVILFGGEDSFKNVYTGVHKVQVVHCDSTERATDIRRKIANAPVPSQDFRSGVIYAINNQYDSCMSTVDAAITNFNGEFILLGKKPGETGWRLPGGFVDKEDSSLEEAVRREVAEETGIGIEYITSVKYIASRSVNDWRLDPNQGIMTTLFHVGTNLRTGEGIIRAGDDLERVQWFPVCDLPKIEACHQMLIDLV